MGRKKILLIGNNSNGMYLFRGMLISELIKQGNDVVVLTPFDLNVNDIMQLGVKMIETQIDRRGMNPTKDIALYKQYKKILNDEEPDLVITYTIKPNIYAGYACCRKKIPYAVNITGLGTMFQNDGALRKMITHMYRTAIKKAKVVFFENAENLNIFLSEKICKQQQAKLLYGAGVDVNHFYCSEYPKDDNGVIFLFIGRVMKEKGVDELFQVMTRLNNEGNNCRLYILGNKEEDYNEVINQNEKAGWLQYFGVQSDVRPFIKESHCFVLPSWHEGMANTNLECASMGRPVITTNIHGCLEAVEDGVSGFLCEKQNADDLYHKMKQFISLSYEERKAMGIAGRKRMEKLFDKRKVVEETIIRL